MHSGILCVTAVLPPPSLAPAIDRNPGFFLVIRETRDVLLTGPLGLVVPLQAAALGQRGLVGTTMGPTQGTGSRQHPPGGNVRTGNILFGISFYLWCLFQLY